VTSSWFFIPQPSQIIQLLPDRSYAFYSLHPAPTASLTRYMSRAYTKANYQFKMFPARHVPEKIPCCSKNSSTLYRTRHFITAFSKPQSKPILSLLNSVCTFIPYLC